MLRRVKASRGLRLSLPQLLLVVCLLGVLASCESSEFNQPTDTSISITIPVSTPESSSEFRDPSAPISGGTGLPDDVTRSDEEVDCENAEDLCDSGEWACDDIADYCDIGPDDGSELPDDWDWDQ